MKFQGLKKEGKIIKITPNAERANSLIKTSEKTLRFVKNVKLTSDTSGVLLSNYYEALIETLHASSYFKGYNITDHKSFTTYIEEILKSKTNAITFDKYRRIRNTLIYHGKEIDINTVKLGIYEINKLIKFIKTTI